MKNLLMISASHRTKGNGSAILDLCQKNITNDEIIVEKIYLKDYKIQNCKGCMKCVQNQRFCHIDDDLKALHDKILAADYLVVAAPVYFLGASSNIKTIIDRLLCMSLQVDSNNRKPGGIIISGGSKGWEGNTSQYLSLFTYAFGFFVKNIITSHAYAPSGILLQDDTIFEQSKSFINSIIDPNIPAYVPKYGCPICYTENLAITSKTTVRCLMCEIDGNFNVDENGEITTEFGNFDLNKSRASTHNLISNLIDVQEWANLVNNKEELKRILKKRRELIK